jgi:hypothetical protein
MTMMEEESEGLKALEAQGFKVTYTKDKDRDSWPYIDYEGKRIRVFYSTYRREYHFALDSKEERMLGTLQPQGVAFPAVPKRIFKPLRKTVLAYCAYLCARQAVIEAYCDRRLAVIAQEKKAVLAIGAKESSCGSGRAPYLYTADSVLFRLEYDFSDFNYTSKKLDFKSYDIGDDSSIEEVFVKARKAGL